MCVLGVGTSSFPPSVWEMAVLPGVLSSLTGTSGENGNQTQVLFPQAPEKAPSPPRTSAIGLSVLRGAVWADPTVSRLWGQSAVLGSGSGRLGLMSWLCCSLLTGKWTHSNLP